MARRRVVLYNGLWSVVAGLGEASGDRFLLLGCQIRLSSPPGPHDLGDLGEVGDVEHDRQLAEVPVLVDRATGQPAQDTGHVGVAIDGCGELLSPKGVDVAVPTQQNLEPRVLTGGMQAVAGAIGFLVGNPEPLTEPLLEIDALGVYAYLQRGVVSRGGLVRASRLRGRFPIGGHHQGVGRLSCMGCSPVVRNGTERLLKGARQTLRRRVSAVVGVSDQHVGDKRL